ncbi:ATP-dependent DNA ligase [Paenibacillus abyssi]|uniref:ATP-dependent DNA ligase family profile domain-containing protein n=1 Tax=Paenibacillus abyssi TaxID=1340531 RepID=A0A917FRS2_9BACL|nr:hypothetical protein [Paenibacillus abyssi]GGF96869.1 hypothetical protein GCM10010916_12650 [Paenibacillus abyssi]
MFYAPMRATGCDHPFDDKAFVFEPKLSGQRLILLFINGQVRLYTRHQTDVTRQYPELHNVPINDAADAVFDGELTYVNPDTGLLEPRTVIERYRMLKIPKIREGAAQYPLRYFVFDVLYYNGEDMRNRPLSERKKLLDDILEENAYYRRVTSVETKGVALFEAVKWYGLEGMIAKRKDSLYTDACNDDWQAIIAAPSTITLRTSK